jgi:RNA polymerase sigma-70 factor (ECF subfamily)
MTGTESRRAGAAPDPGAWLAEHGDALYRFAYYRVFDAAAAEDLVQETLLAAWRAHGKFRGESSVRTWLIGILKRKTIDYLRTRAREAPLADDADDDTLDRLFRDDPGQHWRSSPSAWADPDEALEKRDFWLVFHDCLAGLPLRQAQLFALAEFEGLGGEELCKAAGASPSNVWVMMHRARLRLRQCLEMNWFGRDNEATDADL